MKSREELLRSKGYWQVRAQMRIFDLLRKEFKKSGLTEKEFCKKFPQWYFSNIMNGNFNGSIYKLIELSLLIGKVPVITFKDLNEVIKADNKKWKS